MSVTRLIGKILLSLAIALVLAGIVHEVRCFKKGKRRITRAQLRMRVFTAALLLVVLGMTLAGSFVLPGHNGNFTSLSKHEKAVILSYWSLCLGLSFLLVVLALADVRACVRTYKLQRDEMYLGIAENEEHRN